MLRFKLTALEKGMWKLEAWSNEQSILDRILNREEVEQLRQEMSWAYELKDSLRIPERKTHVKTAKKEKKGAANEG